MSQKEFIEGRAEMEEILRGQEVGCLGLSRGGECYVVPLNYAYAEGRILFHCALTGQKLDWIRANPQVCFTVSRQSGPVRDHPGGKPCHVDSDSVICRGTARIVDDLADRAEVLNTFNRCFRPAADDITPQRVQGCAAVEITLTEMTGRRERERKTTYWRHVFASD